MKNYIVDISYFDDDGIINDRMFVCAENDIMAQQYALADFQNQYGVYVTEANIEYMQETY